jgi:predicted lipopolysaccharide heptosyltransferase III
VTNILVIKLRYIGDVLLATPVLAALRERFPSARVTMLVNAESEPVVRCNPHLDEVLAVDRRGLREQIRFVRALRRHRYDCVVDLTDGDRSALLTALSGAPVRVGFNWEHRWRGLLYSHVIRHRPELHRLERDLEAVRALGFDPKLHPVMLRTSQQDEEEAVRLLASSGLDESERRTPLVMLHPGARYWFKAWPAERFAELAARLAAAGCRMLVGGGHQDVAAAERIAEGAPTAVSIVAGRASLLQFAALLKRCALFIGNDNGAMHVAAAMGTPIVALFGPSNPAEWGPRASRVSVVYKGLDCRPCFHPTCDRGEQNCMRQISVDEVFAQASQLLSPAQVSGRS